MYNIYTKKLIFYKNVFNEKILNVIYHLMTNVN